VGVDVKERFHGASRQQRDHRMSEGPRGDAYLGRSANWKPVIGAVHGHCVGFGFNLALECDLLVASADAKFMIAETKRGISAGPIWAKLHCYMPSKLATELVLTGEPISAESLFQHGLINRLVATGDHIQAARELAARVLNNPPLAVRAQVRISRWQWTRLSDEVALFVQPLRLHLTSDFEESTNAFLEKRPAHYQAR
jgi:enoyl-CoA hydratase/carnithine racemase